MKLTVKLLAVLFLVLGGLSCSKERPLSVQDLAGTWVSAKNNHVTVQLNSNGTAIITDIPGYVFEGNGSRNVKLTRTGTWKISHAANSDGVDAYVDLAFDAHGAATRKMSVIKDNSTITVFFLVGDPDTGQRYEFHKGTL